jgi:protein gp37
MADSSKIEWTEATWNPVTGCTKVSPGCDHCYAERITERFHGKGSFSIVQRDEGKLYLPLKWRKPRRIFVNSMSDLFHDNVPAPFIGRVWRTMAQTPQHTYQILTKRHGRMRAMLSADGLRQMVADITDVWPLPNVWLGVSVESQQWAETRVHALLCTPAAVRWLSCEPLLGPVSLDSYVGLLDWVVVGGESGPGARPMHPHWALSLRDQCVAAEVPFFFKQWGEWAPNGERQGKKRAGRVLDGRTWDEYPEVAA